MDYHRELNIRFVFFLLLASTVISSCSIGVSDNRADTGADSEICERSLDLRVEYTGGGDCPEMCEISIAGDSLFFYDNNLFIDSCSSYEPVINRKRRLVNKLKLENWQVKNLRQLLDAVGPDSICFRDFGYNPEMDVEEVSMYIDGQRRLYNEGHNMDEPIPPALLTLYLYLYKLSPYDYQKDEWFQSQNLK